MNIVPFLGATALIATAAFARESREVRAQDHPSNIDSASFAIGPVASWVKPVKSTDNVAPEIENTGTVFLLVDRQASLERTAFYYHEVRKITSENGLQEGASISISFNPAFEKITFHSIQLVRDGVASERLGPSSIKLAKREKDPLRLTYDPSCSADVVLDDVRVGDLVEFSYTRDGANPLMRGKYSSTYLMQWNSWIARNVFRFVYPASRKINVQAQNGALQPTVATVNGSTELSSEATNVAGRAVEDDVPNGYAPRQRLQISEFDSWAELAQWAMALFDIGESHSPELRAEIDKLRAIFAPDLRVVAALQFVQDEIRDVSIASWVGDHALTPPDEVMRRRSGDDKDKALLLVALLRGAGIDAAPALVSDLYRSGIRQQLPSPELFDHAIVQVRLGRATYWIDPWRTRQRGPLAQIYVASYGYALVLRVGTSELIAFAAPATSWPVKKIVETYRVPAPDNTGELDVVSDYHGLAADQVRASFRENTRGEMQKRYLAYYARSFPEAKPRKLVWFEELPGVDGCRVTESYVIPHIWQLSDDKGRYLLALNPGDISSAIGPTVSPQRSDPLNREYPNKVIEEMNIEMFEEWSLDAKAATTTTDFFQLRDEPTMTGSHVQFDYTYEALRDRVEKKEFSSYNETVTKAKDSIGYTLRYSTAEQLEKARKPSAFNWAVGATGLCFLGSACPFAFRYFRKSRLPNPLSPPVDASARLNGIQGWLILLAIGQVLRPVGYIKPGLDLFSTMLNTNSWRSLTDPIESGYHPWWAPSLLFELFFNLASFVFCLLLIALFFRKRAAWPRCFAVFLILSVLGVVLDTFLIDRIPSAAESIATSIRNIGGMTVAAAIGIPYLYLSKRVKATFRY